MCAGMNVLGCPRRGVGAESLTGRSTHNSRSIRHSWCCTGGWAAQLAGAQVDEARSAAVKRQDWARDKL